MKEVSSRADRDIKKKILKEGDYNIVPYEDSRCKVKITNLKCVNNDGDCPIDAESKIFNPSFDGNILIGDSDCFIDKDVELLLEQMCMKEVSQAVLTYRNNKEELVKEISFDIELIDVTEEQLISDWSWERLYEASHHHKDQGVELVKMKRICDAFRRFSKSLKYLVAIEPVDPEVITEDKVKEMVELRVKLLNNLAHCQLQFDEYEAALELCNRSLKYDPANVKALYRRCLSYIGLDQFEKAWQDIQEVLKIDPQDKLAQQKANFLKPKIEKINQNYASVIKKMFV